MKGFRILYIIITCLSISMCLILAIAFLCYERETLNREALLDISSKWGGKQLIEGPFIIAPDKKYMHTPKTLEANATINPEIRYRGIYKFVVYTAEVQMNARFLSVSKYSEQFKQKEYILIGFNLSFDNGLSDIKASINSVPINFSYDSTLGMFIGKVNLQSLDKEGVVKISLNLRGTARLHITPCAMTNTIEMTSRWKDPSFSGKYLPTSRDIKKDGFTGIWNINSFKVHSDLANHNSSDYSNGVGVDLLMPVDIYRQTERALSYSFLFITIFIVSLIATEYLTKERLDLIQYILSAVTPVVFYLMVLSFAEYIGFDIGFLISALLCSILISCYIGVAIGRLKVGITTFIFNILAYTVMFVLLYLENASLLVGSIVVFIILTILMVITAKSNRSFENS